MTEPPFQEDFFQRIVNVKWGGKARFMFGTFYYNKPYSSNDGKSWKAEADGGESGVYGGMWCRVGGRKNPGKSVWLMGLVQSLQAAVLYSDDGRTWRSIGIGAGGEVSAVYGFSYDIDTGVMYAGVDTSSEGSDDAYLLYSSRDGLSWSGGGAVRGMFLPGISTDGATEETMKYAQVSGGGISGIDPADFPDVYTSVGKLKDGNVYKAKLGRTTHGGGGSSSVVIVNGGVSKPFPGADDIVQCISFGVGADGPVFVAGGAFVGSVITPAISWSADGFGWNPQVATTALTAYVTAVPIGPFYA